MATTGGGPPRWSRTPHNSSRSERATGMPGGGERGGRGQADGAGVAVRWGRCKEAGGRRRPLRAAVTFEVGCGSSLIRFSFFASVPALSAGWMRVGVGNLRPAAKSRAQASANGPLPKPSTCPSSRRSFVATTSRVLSHVRVAGLTSS